MENRKIYIVTSGDYSDYRIVGVFSSEEKANKYIDSEGSEYRLEIYDIDDEKIETDDKWWTVTLGYDTYSSPYCTPVNNGANVFYALRPSGSFREKEIVFKVYADTMTRAIKIAVERLGQVKALEQIKYPELWKAAKRRSYGINFDVYPIYDFYSGEILGYN